MARPRAARSRVTLHSQAASASAIMARQHDDRRRVGPASCASTQTSQAAAAYMGKARNCLKRQHPGAGLGHEGQRARPQAQEQERQRKADAQRHEHRSADSAPCVRAKPSAAAMKGAVQGAATATASTPVKKAPGKPLARGQPLARRDAADFEQAREIEPHREHQQRKARHRDGRLQLEAPADRCRRRHAAARWPVPARRRTAPRPPHRRSFRCRPFCAMIAPAPAPSSPGSAARKASRSGSARRGRRTAIASHSVRSPLAAPAAVNSAAGTGPGGAFTSSAWTEPSVEVSTSRPSSVPPTFAARRQAQHQPVLGIAHQSAARRS